MERLVATPTHVGMSEYFLVANPGTAITEKLAEETKSLNKASKTTRKTHITIASFQAREQMEDTIIRYMQRIFSQQNSFQVALNNYSGIPPNTIYVRIQNPQPFRYLAGELNVVSNYVTSCSCPPVKLVRQPYLPITNELPAHIFQTALMGYSHKTFHETFVVNELVLLKRNTAYDTEKPVQIFRLQPQTTQSIDTLYN
jgi:hypothetical protein